jgi:hypothetical protein
MTFSLRVKTSISCSKCKCVIDLEGVEPDKNRRLAFIEEGVVYCRGCASRCSYSIDDISAVDFTNP